MGQPPIPAAAPVSLTEAIATTDLPASRPASASDFSNMLMGGLDHVNQQLLSADAMAKAFAADEGSIPIHQVTYALEQARLSTEVLLQVRSKLVEGYQDIMRMQL